MKQTNRKTMWAAVCLLGAFGVWTALVRLVDVRAIGPDGSAVGLAALNGYVHALTGVHMPLYVLTDWLGLVPIGTAGGFALLGAVQWIRRKRLWAVDRSILVLGGFYTVVLAAYAFFEICPVNYRPVRIDGRLEASYPSSTTMLVLCVMPTAVMQLRSRLPRRLGRCTAAVLYAFTVFMTVGRLFSGVHWVSDIIGGILLSGGLVSLYASFCREEDRGSRAADRIDTAPKM